MTDQATKIRLIDTTRKLDVLRIAADRSRDHLELPVEVPDLG